MSSEGSGEGSGVAAAAAASADGSGGLESAEAGSAHAEEGLQPPSTPAHPSIHVAETGDLSATGTPHGDNSLRPLDSPFVGTGETPIGVAREHFEEAASPARDPQQEEAKAPPPLEEEDDDPTPPPPPIGLQFSEEEQARRRVLIQTYQSLASRKEAFVYRNALAQSSIAEMLRKRQKDPRREERDRSVENLEERYSKYLASMAGVEREAAAVAAAHATAMQALRDRLAAEEAAVTASTKAFLALKAETAQGAVLQRTGKPIPVPAVREMLGAEEAKERELVQCRLNHLRRLLRLRRSEEKLRQGEELGDGLHLIDFEQLKLENQTHNEKIEERNEDVMKLRNKIGNAVNILSHVKEALHFAEEENESLTTQLKTTEGLAAQQRDVLSRTKRVRDGLRDDNTRLKQQGGLVGDDLLLRDMETVYDGAASLRTRLQELHMQYEQVQRAITEARMLGSAGAQRTREGAPTIVME